MIVGEYDSDDCIKLVKVMAICPGCHKPSHKVSVDAADRHRKVRKYCHRCRRLMDLSASQSLAFND